jgi:hypothetical protein
LVRETEAGDPGGTIVLYVHGVAPRTLGMAEQ